MTVEPRPHPPAPSSQPPPDAREPQLSIVLPCLGAAPMARQSVDRLRLALDSVIGENWEVIVVDDGGGDFEGEPWHPDARVRLLRFAQNRGKGAAVREGMLAALGRCRVYTDVDLPYGIPIMVVMARHIAEGRCHVALGDRSLPGSAYQEDIGLVRRTLSSFCAAFVGTLVTGGFFDTQCGLKGFRGDIAEEIFSMARVDRFSFDVEVIYLSLRFNCNVRRYPVRLQKRDPHSTVRILRDSARAVIDILRIKERAIRGVYDSAELTRRLGEEVERDLERARRLIGAG